MTAAPLVDADSGTPYVNSAWEGELKALHDKEQAENADYVAQEATHVAQAIWLAEVLRRRVLFNHSTGQWHIFNATTGLWLPDRDKGVHRRVVKAATERATRIALTSHMGERRRAAELKVARFLMSKDNIEKTLAVLSWNEDYSTNGDEWDADPNLLGTSSGVVDLTTGDVLPPDPTRRVSMSTGVKFRADWTADEAIAHAPRFWRFLSEVTSGDADLALFYVRWFGYSLFGHSLATKFLILSGKLGFNGKGAMKRLMLHVMGDYAVELDQGFYERKRFTPGANEARADLLKLKGVRAAFVSEPTGSFNTEVLKNHTGGDNITARDLHRGSKDIQSWKATHTITFLTNDIPPVSDVGLAVVDRVMVADFREHFTGNDPSKAGFKDEKLDDHLQAEGEAVLRILVHAAVQWEADRQADRRGLEPVPQRVLEASKSYMDSNDAIGPFIDEACRLGDDEKAAPAVLYDAYKAWHERSGLEGEALSPQAFGSAMGKRFGKAGKPPTYRGLSPLGAMALAERGIGDDDETA